MNPLSDIQFNNTYVNFPDNFYTRQNPTPVSKPELIAINERLSQQLGWDITYLRSPEGLAVLAGNHIPAGADPIATVYAGHQFGHFSPQLGDGRAVLLGEVLDSDGVRQDIQLKGAGPTPYSRNGDGRAAIGPVVREYIVSEAMAALGVPTTRALAAVSTGDTVFRETQLPGAVLTRVAPSHIRVGTFQFFAARRDEQALKQLTQHVIDRHYPEAAQADIPALALLEAVMTRQCELIAQWQSIGFIHCVMNTDNASVAGLTIDYGPCAFMDAYHSDTVFSSIDHQSRYAYRNQPGMAQWNMANFAQCLLPLVDADPDKAVEAAQKTIDAFPEIYTKAYVMRFRHKLGLNSEQETDAELITELLTCMQQSSADFTNTFRSLSHCSPTASSDTSEPDTCEKAFTSLFSNKQSISSWLERWRTRHKEETGELADTKALMRNNNPAYIPRNHRIAQAITAAEQHDYEPVHTLIALLSNPYSEQAGMAHFAKVPEADEIVKATFCGT